MKTRLYYGQPKCFASVGDMEEWLANRKTQAEGTLKGADDSKPYVANMKHCCCREIGIDGTRDCARPPHINVITLPAAKSPTAELATMVCCDNHIQNYLASGWVEIANIKVVQSGSKVCARCCSAQAAAQDVYCEGCLEALDLKSSIHKNDAQRLKEVGYCLNRDLVHGCLIYAEPNNTLCAFCQNYNKLPSIYQTPKVNHARVRTIPGTARPCTITKGCLGTMNAAVRQYASSDGPALWWTCETCKISLLAEQTKAVIDPNLTPVIAESAELEAVRGALDQAGEHVVTKEENVADHLRDMLAE